MKNQLIAIRNAVERFVYKNIFRKIFFLYDPEKIHDRMIFFGRWLGNYSFTRTLTCLFFGYKNKILKQEISGLNFKNPIGLAAGFDKNAELTNILPSVGFGFMEAGSITGEPCEGNKKPRLWRLKKSKGLLVYYGLKNDGCEVIAKRLNAKQKFFPLGISIAKTNNKDTVSLDGGVADYVKAYKNLVDLADYITVNISCPNAYGGCPFISKEYLNKLLAGLMNIESSKPIFLKLSPDLSHEEIDIIVEVAGEYNVTGFICTNLTKKRENANLKDADISQVGGMSGKVVAEMADDLIKYIYSSTKGGFVIVGCGGVFSAQDAYRKIRLGASLIQLITGMIYEGPQLIGEINRELALMLKKDGFSSITQAIGVDNRS